MSNFLCRLLGKFENGDRTWEPREKLTSLPGDKLKPPLNPPSPVLYYPKAITTGDKMFTQGKYLNGYPSGAVIHAHAGRCVTKLGKPADDDVMAYMRQQRLTCFLINRKGEVYQDFPLDEWGYHAGKSIWPGVASKTVHRDFVGIEIMSNGKLRRKGGKFLTHFNCIVPKSEVRVCDHSRSNIQAGAYHSFTIDQEKSLINLLLWLELNGRGRFHFKNVVGHDEVSPGRKSDPGGALSLTMPILREMLISLRQKGHGHL